MLSSALIKRAAAEAGFSLCGIARCRPLLEHGPRLDRWLSEGRDGALPYLRRDPPARLDPQRLLEGARSIVMCAVHYKNGAWDQSATAGPRVASYALAPDYHTSLNRMLGDVLERLCREMPGMRGKCFTDTSPILEKAWAVEAGMGWIGKNSLLVTRRHGTMLVLGGIVLDAPADLYDSPFAGDGCGDCCRCVDECPAQALAVPRTLDARRCISRLTIERASPATDAQDHVPNEHLQREHTVAESAASADPTHGWIFGCDACQSCCPYNVRAPFFSNAAFAPVVDPRTAHGAFWEALTEERFDELFLSTPLKRAGYAALRAWVISLKR